MRTGENRADDGSAQPFAGAPTRAGIGVAALAVNTVDSDEGAIDFPDDGSSEPERRRHPCGEEFGLGGYDPIAVREALEGRADYAAHRFIEQPLRVLRERFDDYARKLTWSARLATVVILILVFINFDPDLRAFYANTVVPFATKKLTLDPDVNFYVRIQAVFGFASAVLIGGFVAWERYVYQTKKDEILRTAKRDLAIHVGNAFSSQLRILSERVSNVTPTVGRESVGLLLEKWREGEAFLQAASDKVDAFSDHLTAALADRRNFSILIFVFWTILSGVLLTFAVDDIPAMPVEETVIVAFALLLSNMLLNAVYLAPIGNELCRNLRASADAIGAEDGRWDKLGLAERRQDILCADPTPHIISAHEHLLSHMDGDDPHGVRYDADESDTPPRLTH